jgi:hypothetical protein
MLRQVAKKMSPRTGAGVGGGTNGFVMTAMATHHHQERYKHGKQNRFFNTLLISIHVIPSVETPTALDSFPLFPPNHLPSVYLC